MPDGDKTHKTRINVKYQYGFIGNALVNESGNHFAISKQVIM